MSNEIAKSMKAPILEAQNPRIMSMLLKLLGDEVMEIPEGFICTLTVTTGFDDNMHCDGVTVTVTGTPP